MYAEQSLKLMSIAILFPAERTGMSPHIDDCDKEKFHLESFA